jgi:hypothetical protein
MQHIAKPAHQTKNHTKAPATMFAHKTPTNKDRLVSIVQAPARNAATLITALNANPLLSYSKANADFSARQLII